MNEEEKKTWVYHVGLPQINPRELSKREDCLSVDTTRRFGIASSQSHFGVVLGFVGCCSEVLSP